jgi:hypothetical protein
LWFATVAAKDLEVSAMPIFCKVIHVFRAPDAGWTEQFYISADTVVEPTEFIGHDFQRCVDWRGTGVTLQAVKSVEEGGVRRSAIKVFNHAVPTDPILSELNQNKDSYGSSLLCRFNFNGGGGRTLSIRGLRDSDIMPNAVGPSQWSGRITNAFNLYKNWVMSTAVQYLGKRLVSKSTVPWKDVISLAADPANANWTRVTISQLPVAIPVGTQVYFQGIDEIQIAWIKGIYRVVGTSTVNAFSIPTLFRGLVDTLTLRNVQFREAQYDYPAIVDGSIVRVAKRDTAGPFGDYRGRRSGRKIRL